jgi:acetyl esterase/lipase
MPPSLGADDSVIGVVGEGNGAEIAIAAAQQAARCEWPVVDPLMLIDPLDHLDEVARGNAHVLDRRSGRDFVVDRVALI